jgi:Saccharopine dehydrogenase NADP binding domain
VKPVLIIGGYGTFGSQAAKALAKRGITVLIAGRDGRQAEEFARALDPGHRGLSIDLRQRHAVSQALRNQPVVVNCAGPFQRLDPTLLETCLESGCHYADIADDRHYCALVRQYGERFASAKLAAVYGCSSLPGISGALGLKLQQETELPRDGGPWACGVTLFIGNDNPKGLAAVSSLVEGLGKPIRAPQGTLRGFHGREVVPLPAPFGRRVVFNFDSPEYDLFPLLFGARNVRVKVGFELTFGSYVMHLLARFGSHYSAHNAKWITRSCKFLRGWGCSGGAVMTEFLFADGVTRRAAILSRTEGQRMAAWPCVLVAEALARSEPIRTGASTAYEFLGAEPLLTQMVMAGFELHSAPN